MIGKLKGRIDSFGTDWLIIAGGFVGAWLGGEVQQAAGASGDAYLIKTDDGDVQRFRSPKHQFGVGEQAFSKNEKVSYRLADILTRLNSGEKLTVKGLDFF